MGLVGPGPDPITGVGAGVLLLLPWRPPPLRFLQRFLLELITAGIGQRLPKEVSLRTSYNAGGKQKAPKVVRQLRSGP